MYCTIEDILADISETILIELTNDSSDVVGYDSDMVKNKIGSISQYMNAFLKGRYPLPISDEGDLEILKPIAVSLVVCELYQRRMQHEISDALVLRKNNALKDLKNIQSGIIKLDAGSTSTKPRHYKHTQRTRYFTDDMMEQY